MWRGNKRIIFQVFSIHVQKITDMLSSTNNLSLYKKLMTVLNKEGTAVNEFYRMIRMAGHVNGAEQRPINDEYVNIMN